MIETGCLISESTLSISIYIAVGGCRKQQEDGAVGGPREQ